MVYIVYQPYLWISGNVDEKYKNSLQVTTDT